MNRQKKKIQFFVINWDTNGDRLRHYDVMPYLLEEVEIRRKKEKLLKKDVSMEWLKLTITNASRYRYWARCEYECIVHGWPMRKNDYKLDIHEQIMMNIDVITELIYNGNYKRTDRH